MNDCSFTERVLNTTKWVQRCLVVTWLVSRETVAVSGHVLCTPYNHAPVYSVTLFKATFSGVHKLTALYNILRHFLHEVKTSKVTCSRK